MLFTNSFNVYSTCNKPDDSIHHGALDLHCTKISEKFILMQSEPNNNMDGSSMR